MSRCMCGATDCDACYGKREPEVDRVECSCGCGCDEWLGLAMVDDEWRCRRCAGECVEKVAKLAQAAEFRLIASTYPAGPWREAALGTADKIDREAQS